MFQNNSINESLLNVVVDLLVFLEFSDEDVVDPDNAVAVMEQVAAELQSLNKEKRLFLVAKLNACSQNYVGDKANFVASLGESLGLTN